MLQTQRNDPCPCGSGKKYKKCHGVISTKIPSNDDIKKMLDEMTKNIQEKEHVNAIPFYKKYNVKELLSILALLSVLPENHGKNIRLEEMIRQAILSDNSGHSELGITELKEFTHANFEHNHLEDPPENLFTQNIMTPQGNRKVFPGITDGQVYTLQCFIQTLTNNNKELPSEFVEKALDTCLLVLSISDLIAEGLNYERNIVEVETDDNNIFFPGQDYINQHKHITYFSKDNIDSIKESLGAKHDLLDTLAINKNEKGLQSLNYYADALIYKPLIPIDTGYIVIATNLVFAITNKILSLAFEHNCTEKFIKLFSKITLSYCSFALKEIGFRQLNFNFGDSGLPIYEGLFLFDSNKLAYITVEYDNAKDYNFDAPLTHHIDEQLTEALDKRRKEIANKLILDERFASYKFLYLNIGVGIGRPRMISFATPNKSWLSLGMIFQDLFISFQSGKLNNLTFWNYAQAIRDYNPATPFFLDNLSYFISNDETFYSSDNKITQLLVAVGNGHKFSAESIQNYDEHLGYYFDDRAIYIPMSREKLPVNLPIYSTHHFEGFKFMVYTPVLGRNVWIEPLSEFSEVNTSSQKIQKEICIAIAYWISEMASDLKNLIPYSTGQPIIIKIDTEDVENADVFDSLDPAINSFDRIQATVTEKGINIFLDKYFFRDLFSSDNFGEIVLMKKVLNLITDFINHNGITCSLNAENITETIERHMPRGQKKKLLMSVLGSDIRLFPHNVTKLRTLNRFEVNKQLDGLAPKISEKPYKPRIIDTNEKVSIVNKAVTLFYKEMRDLLDQFDFIDILKKLFILHESAIQNREHYKFETGPRIECFHHHGNILELLSKENKLNVSTSLSIRCLIEHIVAEPPTGKKEFDLESFDKALAYMYNIINWGFVSDDISFKIADVEVSYLETGRLGTSKDFSNEIIKPFYDSKFSEDIQNSKESFKKKFQRKENKNSDYQETDLDKPFEEEFGIHIDILFQVAEYAILLAFNNEKSYYLAPLDTFIQEVFKATKIGENEIKKCISAFSLINRGKVENVKDYGFKNPDFYPWRYNRALSLLNKPFVIIQIEGIDNIGLSARSVYDSRGHILDSFFSGRYNAKTSSMKSFMSKVNFDKGKSFNKEAFDYLSELGLFSFVQSSVKIGPKGPLIYKDDLGDIDILAVDESNKKILAIECKNTNTSRTPYEIHIELLSFFGKENNGWISKVDKRKEWIISNRKLLNDFLKRDLSSYSFEYVFLTAQVLPLPLIKDLNLQYRFVSLLEAQNNLLNLIIGSGNR